MNRRFFIISKALLLTSYTKSNSGDHSKVKNKEILDLISINIDNHAVSIKDHVDNVDFLIEKPVVIRFDNLINQQTVKGSVGFTNQFNKHITFGVFYLDGGNPLVLLPDKSFTINTSHTVKLSNVLNSDLAEIFDGVEFSFKTVDK